MPMELEGEGWVRVRPVEWDAYFLGVQLVGLARGKAADAEELRPRVRFLHSIYRNHDGGERKELSALAGSNAEAIPAMMEATGSLLPEFAFLCTVIQLVDERERFTTDAYAVIVWQANRPGPRLAFCLDLKTGARFELLSGELADFEGGSLPKVPAWPSRRPELRDLTEAEVLDAARACLRRNEALVRDRAEFRGAFAIGLTSRVFYSFAELRFGGASITPADLPEPPRGEIFADGGVSVTSLMPDATPDDFPEIIARGYDAILVLFEGDALLGGEAVYPAMVAEAIRLGVDPTQLAGVSPNGRLQGAGLFIRDRESLHPMTGLRLLQSWVLEETGWDEAPSDVLVAPSPTPDPAPVGDPS